MVYLPCVKKGTDSFYGIDDSHFLRPIPSSDGHLCSLKKQPVSIIDAASSLRNYEEVSR
jgi:hypothetical protein